MRGNRCRRVDDPRDLVKRIEELIARLVMIGMLVVWSHAGATEVGPFDLSGSLTRTSDYVFRGISQTDEDPTLQAGVKLSHRSGLYASLWGSHVEYGETIGADAEIDYVIGWSGDVADGLAVDVNLTRYEYLGTSDEVDLDYSELIGMLTWKSNYWFQLGYSNDVFASGRSGTYVQLGTRWLFADAWRLETLAGYYFLDNVYGRSYSHAQLSVVHAWKQLELRASAHLTDEDAEALFVSALAGTRAEVAATWVF